MSEIILDGSGIARNATVFRKEVLRVLRQLEGRPGATEVLERKRVAQIFNVSDGDAAQLGERLEIAFTEDRLRNRGAPQSIPLVAGQLGDVTLKIASLVEGHVQRGRPRPDVEEESKAVVITLPVSGETDACISADFPFLEGDPLRSTWQWCAEVRMLEGEMLLTFVDSLDRSLELAILLRFGPPSPDELFAADSLKGMFESICGKQPRWVYTNPNTGLQGKPTKMQRTEEGWVVFAGPFNNEDEANVWFNDHCRLAPTGDGYICSV